MSTIKKEMINGVMWSAIEKYSGVIISLVITSILARLISPEDFGVVSIASVIIAFLNLFTDLGIGPAIIQNKELTKENLDSIFTFTLVGGIILSILFFISAWEVANFYHNDKLVPICHLLSVNLLFAALNIVPHAEMAKNKQFKLIARRTLLLQIISGLVSVFFAFRGLGMYTLLISPIFTAIGVFTYNLKYYPRKIDWKFDLEPMKRIFAFSSYQFLFGFVNYFSRNIDNLLIGKFLGLAPLGFYDKAYRLMNLPLQNVTNVITPVMQPILSSLQDNKQELASKYCKILVVLAIVGFPLSSILFLNASEFIEIMYGPNWKASIPIFKILALSVSLQMLLSSTGAIYQSANKTKLLFINGILNTSCTVIAFSLAIIVFKTLESFAWAWVFSLLINSCISFYILFCIVLKSSLKNLLRIILFPFLSSLLIGILCWILFNKVVIIESNILLIVLKTAFVITFYCALLQLFKFYNFLDLIKTIYLKIKK